MGRDILYPKDLTATIKANAAITVEATNKLLKLMEDDGVDTSGTKCNSGWRPKAINSKTPGSDPNSPHVTAEAIDLSDVNGKIKQWVGKNPSKVKQAGFVATEDFKITSTWCHLQTRGVLTGQMGKAIWLASSDNWKNNYSKSIVTVLT